MENLIPFIKHHWQLWLGLVLVIAFIIFEELKKKVGGKIISPQQCVNFINNENAVTVDIRDETTFKKGHILNSLNIPKSSEFTTFTTKLANSKDKTIIFIGNLESEAESIRTKLEKDGFTKTFTLTGGINSWKNANLPLVKD